MPNNLSASAQVSLDNPANNLVFSLEDNSAPGISIETKVPTKPYGNPIEVTFDFNCINGHLYTVKVWESADTSPSGVVRCSYARGVAGNLVQFREAIFAEVDVTPNWTSASTTVTDSTFIGWDIEDLISNPYYLVRDTEPNNSQKEYSFATDIITLLLGRTLQPNEQWKVTFKPIVTQGQSGVPSGPFGTGRQVTANENFTNTDKNKALLLQSATSTLILGLPPLSGLTDFTDIVYLQSNGGSHKNAVINTQGSDKIFLGNTITQVILGQQEFAAFYKGFGYYHPLYDMPGTRLVGELLYNYKVSAVNTLPCMGQIVNRADYPRLWAWVQTQSAVVSDANWTGVFVTHNGNTVFTNQSKFSMGNGTTTFRLPLLIDTVLRGIDGGTSVPGEIQLDQVGQHDITAPLVARINPPNNFGFTDGQTASPTTETFTQLAGQRNLIETSGTYVLVRY